ncbi:MAG: NACHT domain-containing protein [Anaerolineales bacterium]|nr:NACHT domain-containing protein [Anaerolineales bacterium]
MNPELLERLSQVSSAVEREAIVFEMSLSALSDELQNAVQSVAVPHWFDAFFLDALLEAESDELYDQLLTLSFVEQVPGKGYAIHERTRKLLLQRLWQNESDYFRELSRRAASYCAGRESQLALSDWQAEIVYHQLVCDPEAGIDGLRQLATQWANYQFHTYDEIEYTLRLAQEQLEARRLDSLAADWVRLWQAKLALLLEQSEQAALPLGQITAAPLDDLRLAAEVAETQGDLLALTEADGLAEAWTRAFTLYGQLPEQSGQLDAYLVAEKMRQHGLPGPEAVETPTTAPARLTRNARQLIENIEAAWIDGVLKPALNQEIDLQLTRDSSQAANLVLHRPQGLDRPVVQGQRLSRLFAATGRSLLILGAPGSGKTITLLQLLEELLGQARANGNVPIPLLFNLSSFAAYSQEEEADLLGWLAEQANTQYRLKRQTAREQLLAGRFTLLLDGLDEVSNEDAQREQCVTAINNFMGQTPCGLVVCSRIGDYQLLQNRLAQLQALVLQPLSNRQIETFLARDAPDKAATMIERLQKDWQLRETLRSPFLLSLYPQAFDQLEEQTGMASESVETRRQALFAAYVETVFDQPDVSKKATLPDKSKRWLTFLANRLQQMSSSLFYVEELQPTWLPPKLMGSYRGLYGLLNGLIVGLIIGSIIGLIIVFSGELSDALSVVLMIVLMIVLFSGLGGGGVTRLTTRIQKDWLRVGGGGLLIELLIGVAFGPSGKFNIGLNGGLSGGLIDGLLGGLILGLFFGLGIIITVGISSLATVIQLRERVRPTRPSLKRVVNFVKKGIVYGLLVGLLGGFIIWPIFALIDIDANIFSLVAVLFAGSITGLFAGLLGGVFGFFLAFLDTPPVDKRSTPGNGTRASLRNAILMTILVALLFGIAAWYFDQRFEGDLFIFFVVLVNILPPTFTWFGGLAWCQHWALRFMLARRGWLSWRLVHWLEEMVARGLLRRVGGGYIFIHRSLLEYFASLEGK